MRFTVPSAGGPRRLREFNPCHLPPGDGGGQFATKGQGNCVGGATGAKADAASAAISAALGGGLGPASARKNPFSIAARDAVDAYGKPVSSATVALLKRYTLDMEAAARLADISERVITGKPPAWLEPTEYKKHFPQKTDAEIAEMVADKLKAIKRDEDEVRPLVDAIRNAPKRDTTLYRAVYAVPPDETRGDFARTLEALKPGDRFDLNRISSFSASREQAGQFAMTPQSISAGTTDPGGDMHPSDADDYVNYEFKLEGEHTSLDVSKESRYGEKEHLTFGQFEVVRIEHSTHVMAKTLGTFPVNYRRTIVVRQVSVKPSGKPAPPPPPPPIPEYPAHFAPLHGSMYVYSADELARLTKTNKPKEMEAFYAHNARAKAHNAKRAAEIERDNRERKPYVPPPFNPPAGLSPEQLAATLKAREQSIAARKSTYTPVEIHPAYQYLLKK